MIFSKPCSKMLMVKKGLVLSVLLSFALLAAAQERMSREEYIAFYADLAMDEMKRTGIPASITLAQACLESDNGNSRLARQGNNHFGIKCHDWTGKKIYHDDDEKDECFRKYRDAYQSFIDHSEFLTEKSRYAELFDLKPDDYRRWSRGLEKAGYATSRQYAELLIRIIDENELYRYDQMVLAGDYQPSRRKERAAEIPGREVLTNNRIEYIITRPGDTPRSLRDEMELYPWEIYRYNDISRGEALDTGMVIYLQPKRRRAAKGNEIHMLEEGQTLTGVSQLYGVKVRHLVRYNRLDHPEDIQAGDKVWLRRKKPKAPAPEPIREKEQEKQEPVQMEFEFDGGG